MRRSATPPSTQSAVERSIGGMKKMLPAFEHRAEPLIPQRQFLIRLARSGMVSAAFIVFSLAIGMIGYHALEGLSWIDAFLNASMLLGGMGPVTAPNTFGGKMFAGIYALYCGLAVLAAASVLLAPVLHRLLHRFHMEGETPARKKKSG